jgi:signal peptidase I
MLIYGVVCFYSSQFIGINTTYSEPLGYYFYYYSSYYNSGDYALICLEDSKYIAVLNQLKIARQFPSKCKDNLPYLVKNIVAVAGDFVSISLDGITVNNYRYPNSRAYRAVHGINLLPQPFGTYKLKADEFFVLGSSKTSYDSRYFGIINKNQLRGKALFLMPLIFN